MTTILQRRAFQGTGNSRCRQKIGSSILGRREVPRFQFKSVAGRTYASSSQSPGDKALSILPYILPLCDALRYGKFLLLQYPIFNSLLIPVVPFARLYFSNPIVQIGTFFALYFGVVNNRNIAWPVRYNAMQAVLLDLILIVPGLLESTFRPPVGSGLGLQLYITCYNSIFLFILVSVVYAAGSTIAGQLPRLPLVGDAAEQQVR